MHMKKYIVLEKGPLFNATVIREFDDEDDAKKYAELMAVSEKGKHEFYVAKLLG